MNDYGLRQPEQYFSRIVAEMNIEVAQENGYVWTDVDGLKFLGSSF